MLASCPHHIIVSFWFQHVSTVLSFTGASASAHSFSVKSFPCISSRINGWPTGNVSTLFYTVRLQRAGSTVASCLHILSRNSPGMRVMQLQECHSLYTHTQLYHVAMVLIAVRHVFHVAVLPPWNCAACQCWQILGKSSRQHWTVIQSWSSWATSWESDKG